jgi:putative ABC transport system permease protein
LEQRRRELAILRALGASPWRIFSLLMLEGGGMTLAGALVGWLLWTLSILLLAPWLQAQHGLQLTWQMETTEWLLLGAITVAGCIASLLPGWRAYRLSLADGLHPR